MLDPECTLVVEDNPETNIWLCQCVASAFMNSRVDSVESFHAAHTLVKMKRYQLALIDLGLPDGSGLDLIKELSRLSPECHVIVATIYDDDRSLIEALKSGAKGYILKDQDKDRVVDFLQGIKQNSPAISDASSQRLIEHFNNKGRDLDAVRLTEREKEVTCLIAKGYNVDEAAGVLELAPDTVKGYVKNVYAKLDVSNRSEITLKAVQLGLIDA